MKTKKINSKIGNIIWTAGVCILFLITGCGSISHELYRGYDSNIKIDSAGMQERALIVVDVQNAFLQEDIVRSNKEVLMNINRLISEFRDRGDQIVFIIQIVEPGEYAGIHKPEQIISMIRSGSSPVIFTKNERNAFSNPELQKYLNAHHIGNLFITGMAAEYCVNDTIRGALCLGYLVNTSGDCIIAEEGMKSLNKKMNDFKRYGVQVYHP